MKLFTSTLIATFTCAIVFAQPGNLKKIEHELFLGKDGITVSEFFEFIKIDKDKFFNEQKIDDGSVYYIREYESFQKLSFATEWFDYMLLVDSEDDEILYSTVEISGVKSPSRDDVFAQYHTSFAAYVKEHETFYEVEIDLEDEDMSPLTNFVFGTGCGWDGPLPEKGQKMFELINTNDQATLMSWVKSMNPSIQAYGVMGLRFIELNGEKIILKKKEKKLVEHVKTKKTVIDYCSNIDLNSTTPMNAVLNDFYLDSIYELYKESKYMRD